MLMETDNSDSSSYFNKHNSILSFGRKHSPVEAQNDMFDESLFGGKLR